MSITKKITPKDKEYPQLLREITKYPEELYCQGDISLLNKPAIAIVGSRKTSTYGVSVTKLFANSLASSGLVIVSGLALGTDALAHKETLLAKGKTIAVLGSGINDISPKTNLRLAQEIIDSGGLIISEFSPDTPPYPWNFPQRNRIIAGLCLGTLITEAAQKSGALITAYLALEQNREVFAVPGSIFSQNSQGTNKLIKAGANTVVKPEEIFDTLKLNYSIEFPDEKIANKLEQQIIDILKHEPLHIDKIANFARLDISTINSTVVALEMKGLIQNLGNQIYYKKS